MRGRRLHANDRFGPFLGLSQLHAISTFGFGGIKR
jgi:hypothetical protein